MEIVDVLWKERADFNAVIRCEHCGHHQPLYSGYDDATFHDKVIPSIKCAYCDKRTLEHSHPDIHDPGYSGAEKVTEPTLRFEFKKTYKIERSVTVVVYSSNEEEAKKLVLERNNSPQMVYRNHVDGMPFDVDVVRI